MLSKYDDIDVVTGDRELKPKKQFRLGASTMDLTPEEQEMQAVRERLKQTQSLDTLASSAATDYYTQEEMAQFKKKKHRKIRKKTKVGGLRKPIGACSSGLMLMLYSLCHTFAHFFPLSRSCRRQI